MSLYTARCVLYRTYVKNKNSPTSAVVHAVRTFARGNLYRIAILNTRGSSSRQAGCVDTITSVRNEIRRFSFLSHIEGHYRLK